QRRSVGRGARPDARARRLLQPGLARGKARAAAKGGRMGATAGLTLRADAVDSANSFIWAFAAVYTVLIFCYILTSWVRLPYSPWLSRIQRFLYDVSSPTCASSGASCRRSAGSTSRRWW